MDKGSGSSLHGSLRADPRQTQANTSESLRQGQPQPLWTPGLFSFISQNAIYPQQMHQDSQYLAASGPPQLFPFDSQNVIYPEQMHQFHNRAWGPNFCGPFPYGHPPVSGFTLTPVVQLAPQFPSAHNSQGAGIGVLPPPSLPYPMTAYPIWQRYPGISVLAPVTQLLPPPPYPGTAYPVWQQDPQGSRIGVILLPLPPPPPPPTYPMRAYPQLEPVRAEIGVLPPLSPPPPYPVGAYPTWREDLHWCTVALPPLPSYPMTAFLTWQHEPSAPSSLYLAPREIQFQGVVGQHGGRPFNQLPHQNLHQMGTNIQQNNRPFAEVQQGTWIDPLFPPWHMRNSYYDLQHEELLMTNRESVSSRMIEMDKRSGSSSLHGSHAEEADSGQNQTTSAVSLSQRESQLIAASGPPPQRFLSNPQQMHLEPQPLGASRSPLWTPQHFSSNSQNSVNPEHIHQFHSRVLEPNLHGPFPYGHPPIRGINPRNDYQLPAVSKLPPEHGLTPKNSGDKIGVLPPQPPLPPPLPLSLLLPPQPYPLTAYPTWQEDPERSGTGVVLPHQTLPPPQPSLTPPPSPMSAYPTRQRHPVVAGIGILPLPRPRAYPRTAYPTRQPDPTAASGYRFLAPQEIQSRGVVGRPGGNPSNQLPYQNVHQQGFPRMRSNSHRMVRKTK